MNADDLFAIIERNEVSFFKNCMPYYATEITGVKLIYDTAFVIKYFTTTTKFGDDPNNHFIKIHEVIEWYDRIKLKEFAMGQSVNP